MVRIKRGTSANKRRKNVLKTTKGYKWGRKSKYRLAKDAMKHASKWSYRDRKTKKREFRRLWAVNINGSCRKLGITYSRLINGLKINNIAIDRKILSQLTKDRPDIFEKIVEAVKISK
ncbi:MAG: 50S ribosomal protein L20 [Candidatus Staskawiczbacteria bacterium]|nr:50S ribosomal protein L20 [Candidatus Staskawiczbacteria bacterium]